MISLTGITHVAPPFVLTETEVATGPFCVIASQAFTPGVIKGTVYMACIEAKEIFTPGDEEGDAFTFVVASETYTPEQVTEAFIPGAERGQGGCK